ncbi:hypothetical protein LB505_009442 [Fusarium chuoi]|nr:hypothetical protein LB505_009442 [Fusarium chuoi]
MHVGETQDDIKLSQQCLQSLHEELIKLYSALLNALKYSYSISSQHKVKRIRTNQHPSGPRITAQKGDRSWKGLPKDLESFLVSQIYQLARNNPASSQ